VLSADVPDGTHDQVWRTLRDRHGTTGWWPVLSWAAHMIAEETADYSPEFHGPEALSRALRLPAAQRMAAVIRWSFDGTAQEDDPIEQARWWADEYDPFILATKLEPVTVRPPGRATNTGEATAGVELLLVPARAGYEVPLLVPGLITPSNWFGPPEHPDLTGEDHVRVLQYWHERYGADLYFASGTNLELSVRRPPSDPLDRAMCAIEQFAYCFDLEQRLGDNEVVARVQAPADHWSFWWD
jgi:hypothetical protein